MRTLSVLTVLALTFGSAAPASAIMAAPTGIIRNAVVSADQGSITVYVSAPIQKGYIRYERRGSGNGYDESSFQFRADGQATVVLNVRDDFVRSGTTGTQTITLQACLEVSGPNDVSCGPEYPLTILLGQTSSFADVRDSHPNAQAIRFVQEQGIVAGYPDHTFKPDSRINRAEFTKIVTLALFGQRMIDQCGTVYPFSDVPRDAWYVHYICRARDGWLLTGYPDGTFGPARAINVGEAAKILANGYGLVQGTEQCNGKLCPDADSPEHPWYERYVRALAERNAIPVSVAHFDQAVTRGEMAEMIYRLRAPDAGKPSRTYEELAGAGASSTAPRYTFVNLSSSVLKNYARNVVYRYAITAPAGRSAVITSQSFSLDGGRWSGPQLAVHSDAAYAHQIDTWASDDNWTDAEGTTLRGSLVIPPGETRYLQLSINVGTPADAASVQVKQANLPAVTWAVEQ